MISVALLLYPRLGRVPSEYGCSGVPRAITCEYTELQPSELFLRWSVFTKKSIRVPLSLGSIKSENKKSRGTSCRHVTLTALATSGDDGGTVRLERIDCGKTGLRLIKIRPLGVEPSTLHRCSAWRPDFALRTQTMTFRIRLVEPDATNAYP